MNWLSLQAVANLDLWWQERVLQEPFHQQVGQISWCDSENTSVDFTSIFFPFKILRDDVEFIEGYQNCVFKIIM